MSEPARRPLGLFDATMLVMGGILGVGIFFNPQQVAARVPSEKAFLAAWLLGGLVACCGAFTFAELGGSFPRAGGWYVYLRECFGGLVSFLFAWVVLFVVSTGALAVLAGFCVSMLSGVLPWVGEPGSASQRAGAMGLIVAITLVACLGLKVGALFQSAIMLVKLAAVAALVAGGLLLAAPAGPIPAALHDAPGPGPSFPRSLAPAMLPVLFACGGWQMLGYAASEVKDAQRTIPRAVLLGVGSLMALYLLLNLGYLRTLGLAGLAADPGFVRVLAERAYGPRAADFVSLALALSALGITTVIVIATPWIYVALAREGEFFRPFARLSQRTGAPLLALGLQCVIALAYVHLSERDPLVDSVVFVEWIFHALAAAALLLLRRRRPSLPRPYASPLYPLFPALYLLAALAVVLGTLTRARTSHLGTALAILALGLVAYPLLRHLRGHATNSDGEGAHVP